MNKILIDDAILERAFAALAYALSKTSDAKEKLMFFTPMIDIQKATIESKQKRFTVFVWHGYENEKPPKKGWYYVRTAKLWTILDDLQERVKTELIEPQFWNGEKFVCGDADAVEWAHLSDEEENEQKDFD